MTSSRTSPPRLAFGPVPSRRLGQSLGINNIPPKTCSYSCVYCQVGRTLELQANRRTFYPPADIVAAVAARVDRLRQRNERIDALTVVSDGEPTLDRNLGALIGSLKPLGIRTAVITNASLLAHAEVRAELAAADWVSLKVDAVHERIWRRLNSPHGTLDLARILRGVLEFSCSYPGELVTETMLVEGYNDEEEHLREVASFLAVVKPARAYLAVPLRPPAKAAARVPAESVINGAVQLLQQRLRRVEYLIGYEGNAFAATGDAIEDLLAITAVHPMRREAVADLLARCDTDWSVIHALIARGAIVEHTYRGETFYLRRPRRAAQAE
jgi:wyosine [tRNA(Phe)-imidazoG37] synthetase (radical SAM superfamily)